MQMFKKTIEVPSDENLMELKDMIKGTIEETFVPEEELKEFYETDTEEEAEVEAEAVVEPEPEPEAEPATEIEPETEAEVPQ